ncbi:BT_3987 domain-containing protein [Mucilaginibacter flavus]|uniref:BT_3987 domain-containing protein n=1 Tax=Mucilaginibacter flavus TaxID=931504 RepID=UPI0025B5438D|nr:DUF1735 domain-containing protein [Mucilaginibacter flavus]MDN3580899.1 DUF1735 domain-containing protein [Mucilaginibacter flavus]
MLTSNISKYILFFGLAASSLLYGCKDKVDLPNQPVDSYSKVYMPEAVNNPVVKTFKITDSVQTATYGADFGGQDYPTTDIPITFTVNSAMVDSFNVVNKTNYPLLPAASYTLSNTSGTILKGQLSTSPFSISFKTKGDGAMDALKTYLLPISIATSAAKVNPVLRTTFYQVKAQPDFNDYPNYDRTKWAVIGFSSQEASGEGPNNGRAIFALDGNINTFWHSNWSGAAPGPPHFIIIDMGAVATLHGLSFVGRQGDGAGKPNEVNVKVSLDNITWVDAGTFNLLNNKDLQKQFLPGGFKDARYFKVTINSAYNASYMQVAELNAF